MLIVIPGNQPAHKLRRAEMNRKSRYGMSPLAYEVLMDRQGGKCAVCSTSIAWPRAAHVDHCRKTKKVRGLLCPRCNRANGMYGDDATLLHKAAEYLE